MAFATTEIPVSQHRYGHHHQLEKPSAPKPSAPVLQAHDKEDELQNKTFIMETETSEKEMKQVEIGVIFTKVAAEHAEIVTAYFKKNGRLSALYPCDDIEQFKASVESLSSNAVLYLLVDEKLRQIFHTQYADYTQLFKEIAQSEKTLYVVSYLEEEEDFQEVKYKLPKEIRKNIVPREKFRDIANGLVNIAGKGNVAVQIGDRNQLEVDTATCDITGTQIGGNSTFHYRSEASFTGFVLTVKTPESDHQLDVSIKKHIDDNKEHINITLKDLHAEVTSTKLGSVIIQVAVKDGTKIGPDWLKKLISRILSEEIITRLPQGTRMEVSIQASLSLQPLDVDIFDHPQCLREFVDLETGKTFIHHAAAAGSLSTVKELLSLGVDSESRDVNKNTPLHEAAKSGNVETVDLLIKMGADIKAKNIDMDTPLHVAAMAASPRCIESFLNAENLSDSFAPDDAGSDLEYRKMENRDIHTANGYLAVELLKAKANTEAKDKDGNTPLHTASEAGNLEVIELLLAKCADVNVRNTKGQTPLHRAAATGNLVIASKLISSDGINKVDIEGNTPFHVINRDKEVRSSKQDNKTQRSDDGSSPLHIALQYANVDAASLLIRCGQNVNAVDKDLQTPLHIVSMKKSKLTKYLRDTENASLEHSISQILMKSFDINAQNIDGNTPLHNAMLLSDKTLIMILLKFGADVSVVNKAGETVFHSLAKTKNLDWNDASSLVNVINENDGNINAQDAQGDTPLHVAVAHRNESLGIILTKAGAHIHRRNKRGKSPMEIIENSKTVFPNLYSTMQPRRYVNDTPKGYVTEDKREKNISAVSDNSVNVVSKSGDRWFFHRVKEEAIFLAKLEKSAAHHRAIVAQQFLILKYSIILLCLFMICLAFYH